MDVKYVYQYLLSPVIKDEIRKHTRETTQANVGIASIEIFVFPLCSLPEQHHHRSGDRNAPFGVR
jgi:type I restriction enzyme S subunit